MTSEKVGSLKDVQAELESTRRSLKRSERQIEKLTNYNEDLRKQIESLSSELHKYRTVKRTDVEIQVDKEDLLRYSLGEVILPDWGQGQSQSTVSSEKPIAELIQADLLTGSSGPKLSSSKTELAPVENSAPLSIAESLKETAEAALQQTGFVYDDNSGLYYDYNSGYYYDSEKSLYYDPNTGTYFYFNPDTNEYQFHSKVDVSCYQWQQYRQPKGQGTNSSPQREVTGISTEQSNTPLPVKKKHKEKRSKTKKKERLKREEFKNRKERRQAMRERTRKGKKKEKKERTKTRKKSYKKHKREKEKKRKKDRKNEDTNVYKSRLKDDSPSPIPSPSQFQDSNKVDQRNVAHSPKDETDVNDECFEDLEAYDLTIDDGDSESDLNAEPLTENGTSSNSCEKNNVLDRGRMEQKMECENGENINITDKWKEDGNNYQPANNIDLSDGELDEKEIKEYNNKVSNVWDTKSELKHIGNESRPNRSVTTDSLYSISDESLDSENNTEIKVVKEKRLDNDRKARSRFRDGLTKNMRRDGLIGTKVEDRYSYIVIVSDSESEVESGELTESDSSMDSDSDSSFSRSSSSSSSTGSSSDCESEQDMESLTEEIASSTWPPCIRAIVTESDCLEVGDLFIVAYTGGSIGREGDSHVICLPDVNVSKVHALIQYSKEQKEYMIIDQGSQNGTYVNSQRLSQRKEMGEACFLRHEDILQLGNTKLLCHIHNGTDTCDACEPGIVKAEYSAKHHAPKEIVILSKEEKMKLQRNQLKQIKQKYGLKNAAYIDNVSALKNPNYEDKAEIRRKTKGSDNPHQKTVETPASVHRPISEGNIGHKMLRKMGWSEGESLGRDNTGIQEPVMVTVRTRQNAGLGSSLAGTCSADDVQTVDTVKAKRRLQALIRYQQVEASAEAKEAPGEAGALENSNMPETGASTQSLNDDAVKQVKSKPTMVWTKGETQFKDGS